MEVLSPPDVGLGFVLSSDFLILYKSLGLNKMSDAWLKHPTRMRPDPFWSVRRYVDCTCTWYWQH